MRDRLEGADHARPGAGHLATPHAPLHPGRPLTSAPGTVACNHFLFPPQSWVKHLFVGLCLGSVAWTSSWCSSCTCTSTGKYSPHTEHCSRGGVMHTGIALSSLSPGPLQTPSWTCLHCPLSSIRLHYGTSPGELAISAWLFVTLYSVNCSVESLYSAVFVQVPREGVFFVGRREAVA
jgi:hypothetical protein